MVGFDLFSRYATVRTTPAVLLQKGFRILNANELTP